MGIHYPTPLARGHRVFITAPSSGVAPALHARLDLTLQHLRQQGFVVEEGRCLRQEARSASAPAAERAAELMQALLRDDVAAIIPPWGGELAIELLDRLDWAALVSGSACPATRSIRQGPCAVAQPRRSVTGTSQVLVSL